MHAFSSFDAQVDKKLTLLDFCKQLSQHPKPFLLEANWDQENARFFCHNQTAYELFLNSKSALPLCEKIEELLEMHKSFDIPILENGSLVAAGVSKDEGEYGRAVWLRDLGRVFEAAFVCGEKEKARRMAMAILRCLSSEIQQNAFFKLMKAPELYQQSHAHQICPRIRLDAWTQLPIILQNGEEHEWEHLQHDALAISFFSIFQAIDAGLISFEELKATEADVLFLIPSYFVAIQAWKQKDSGAWEEWRAKRSSSVGLVLQCLETASSFFENPTYSSRFPEYFPELEQMQKSLREAKLSLEGQFGQGEAPFENSSPEKRGPDAALSHLLWYRSNYFDLEKRSLIYSHLKKIKREAGIPRYETDIYMQEFFYFQERGNTEEVPSRFLKTPKKLTRSDLWSLYNPRQPEKSFKIFSENTEPQWCIHDSILSKACAEDYLRTGDSKFKGGFLIHFLRSLGQLTRENAMASDGSPKPAFQMPEAYIPFFDHQEKRWIYLPSKNTPLYWAAAELRILLHFIRENKKELDVRFQIHSKCEMKG